MKNFSPVSEMRKSRRRVVARNSRNKENMAKHKVITSAHIIALATLIGVSLLSNGMLMMTSRHPGNRAEVFFMEKFSTLLTEISATEPARPLIWTHRNSYKGFRGKAGSGKAGVVWRGPFFLRLFRDFPTIREPEVGYKITLNLSCSTSFALFNPARCFFA